MLSEFQARFILMSVVSACPPTDDTHFITDVNLVSITNEKLLL